ncbi:hypothetical protein N8I77_005295 [Diaporthe amygdali]|uniref:Uncharacterized protein n=1 Tax=Phomopsis amygdali TaxID=1214568 RepID=A0AAD9SFV9_PHOAM|nr:hypothetical protein N8I77_005295 [Diaporthe amygdali]
MTRETGATSPSELHTAFSKVYAKFGLTMYEITGLSSRLARSINKNVVVVSASLPKSKALQSGVHDVLSLDGNRLGVVVGHVDVAGGVPEERCLAAVVIGILDAREGLGGLVQEVGLGDQTPERICATWRRGRPTLVDRRVVVPAAALEAVARVLGGVQLQGVGAVHGGRLVDAEAVAVGREAENELVGGDTGVDPGLDAELP